MDPLVQQEISRLAELGTQSPLHAVRATERINRLLLTTDAAPRPGISQTIERQIEPLREVDPVVQQHMDILPAGYQAKHARIPAPPQPSFPTREVLAPTQYPPVMDARNHPPSYAQTVQPLMSPTLYLTVPDIPVITPGLESPGERLDFSLGDGILIGMRGTVLVESADGAPSTGKEFDALCGLKITINGQEQLIVDGETESWAWFSDLFGGAAVQWTPIQRHVLSSDIMQVRFLNRSVGGADAPDIQPSLMFAYRRLPMPV